MVLKSVGESAKRLVNARNILLYIAGIAVGFLVIRITIWQSLTEFVQQNIIAPTNTTAATKPAFVDMQGVVEDFIAHQTGTVAVVVYDIENERYSAIYNSDKSMSLAAVYQIFPVYETYLRMETGEMAKDEVIFTETKNETQVEYTREKCAELVLRESHAGCAEKLVDEIGQDYLNQIGWETYDLINTSGSTSTAGDIAKMMRIYYDHRGLSEETWNKIRGTLWNQPKTKEQVGDKEVENDWRQGLPNGFHLANVYNKAGWLGEKDKWKIYNDAAIVEFPSFERSYIIVVMTTDTDPKAIANLGNYIEQAVVSGAN